MSTFTCAKSGELIGVDVYSELEECKCICLTPLIHLYESSYDGYTTFAGVDIFAFMVKYDEGMTKEEFDKLNELGKWDKIEKKKRREYFRLIDGGWQPPFELKIVKDKYYEGEDYDDPKLGISQVKGIQRLI